MKPTNVLVTTIALLGVAIPMQAAPAVRDREQKLPPPTPEQLEKSSNNLKQIALAWHNFESTNGFFPGNLYDAKGKPLLSWRVSLLPYLEEGHELYQQFKLDQPWDSEHNLKLIEKMPALFAPIRVKAAAGETFYLSTAGKHGLLKNGKRLRIADFFDGTSNTLIVVEAERPVVWTKPQDLEFDGEKLPPMGGLFEGRFHAAMGDGSVLRFRKGISTELLGRLIDPGDGQVIRLDEAIDRD